MVSAMDIYYILWFYFMKPPALHTETR